MLTGLIFSYLTFPGVVLHEFAHKLFCRIFNVPVLDVAWFKFDGGGHVIHAETNSFNASFWITTGPLFINSSATILIGCVSQLLGGYSNFISATLVWLSISFGSHSFPSNTDADLLIQASKKALASGGTYTLYLCYPFVWIIKLANVLRTAGFDLMWAFFLLFTGLAVGGHIKTAIFSLYS